ncbi:MAG: lycopene cyclase domain-containing protein [Bacteroidia bacterium]|nr:lycopene cyclase domain-containing protein [Paludibacter sp.]MDD3491040.1 lycopene cyclase domain-containing protein [Paludibacter sp.]NCB67493.1 lycopene cyclase domain-containing protein [Bacteroidia bacterium]
MINAEKLIYIGLMAGSVLFPFLFSFEKQISFYKKWKYLFVAILVPLVFFVVWDAIFTANGMWSFNENFVLGPHIFGLPIEEWLFFVVVPYCGVFIYEVLKLYLPRIDFNKAVYGSFVVLVLIFALLTLLYSQRDYTFFNFLFNTIFLSFMLFNNWFKKHLTHFFLAFLIALIPMFVVNGVLTAMPVVEYNPFENSGIRVYTIPFEDFFYFQLLFGMNVMIYEWLQRKKKN